MKKFTILVLGLLIPLALLSHPWKPGNYVIIDTDGGLDDMKTLCMMLSSPDVRVLAVICSPGSLSAENTYIKVKSLLNSFHHEGIPVGINNHSGYKSSDFPQALNYIWGEEKGINTATVPDYISVIRNIFRYESSKISMVCLAGMTTASSAIREIEDFMDHITQVIWSCDGLEDRKGFNFSIDKQSSLYVLKHKIPVNAITGCEEENFYTGRLRGNLGMINTPYARKIDSFLSSETSVNHPFALQACDEMTALFLHYPQLFKKSISGKNNEYIPVDIDGLREGCIKIAGGETVPRNQVIAALPTNPGFYFEDINPFVDEIINKYGIDEWTSGVIANELHRHLGVFAIIGVKMGIRAREYFNTGVDEFTAISYAGSVPPLSCMNDGIQVSTGATPGHGLLRVRTDTVTAPMVEFTYLSHMIRIRLKPEYAEKISGELKELNFVYGLDSNIYWELVRKNSIRYWRDLDRHQIFEIEVIY